MNINLHDYLFHQTKEGKSFRFSLTYASPQEGPIVEFDNELFSGDIIDDFENWVHLSFIEYLVGIELYNGGDFKFELLNDELQINCATSLQDINNSPDNYSIKDVFSEKVLMLLFNKNEVKSINVDDIYLQFEYEYNYSSNIWSIELLENSSHYIEGIEDFDFSIINTPKLKELIYLNIKDLKHNDCEPNIKYSNSSKYISCQDSNIGVTEYISLKIPISKP
jgi:hypothetical protein